MDTVLLVRLPGVIKMTGLGRSTIYKLMAEKKFPLPVRLTQSSVAWRCAELGQWCETRERAGQRQVCKPGRPGKSQAPTLDLEAPRLRGGTLPSTRSLSR